jgi:LacI family transcriptional regulator
MTKAAFNAVQHLIDNGCRKIAHIRGPLNPQNAIDRFMDIKSPRKTTSLLIQNWCTPVKMLLFRKE